MSHDERDVETLCEVMHDAYEAAATREGWETQERSRKPWADVPEANKATMRAAVRAVLDALDLPGRERRAKAEALRDAADDWQTGGWAGREYHRNRVADRLAAAQYATDWLRLRAAEIDPEEKP